MKQKLEKHPILCLALGAVIAGLGMVTAVGGAAVAAVLPLSILLGL